MNYTRFYALGFQKENHLESNSALSLYEWQRLTERHYLSSCQSHLWTLVTFDAMSQSIHSVRKLQVFGLVARKESDVGVQLVIKRPGFRRRLSLACCMVLFEIAVALSSLHGRVLT